MSKEGGTKMSRLIDADKLVEICRKGWKLFGRDDEKLKHWVDENDIREQPTIKAIPIEFIERKLAEHWYVDYDIRELLVDWEKENETN